MFSIEHSFAVSLVRRYTDSDSEVWGGRNEMCSMFGLVQRVVWGQSTARSSGLVNYNGRHPWCIAAQELREECTFRSPIKSK